MLIIAYALIRQETHTLARGGRARHPGVPVTVSTRRAATQSTPKFEELNRRAAIQDHRHRNTFRRRIRGGENFLSLNRGLKVVYFKRYVGD